MNRKEKPAGERYSAGMVIAASVNLLILAVIWLTTGVWGGVGAVTLVLWVFVFRQKVWACILYTVLAGSQALFGMVMIAACVSYARLYPMESSLLRVILMGINGIAFSASSVVIWEERLR